MSHQKNCNWMLTTLEECEYRDTHRYCPHPEHACNCVELPDPIKQDEAELIVEGVYRWTMQAARPDVLGTGKAKLLSPTEAREAILAHYIPKQALAAALERVEKEVIGEGTGPCDKHNDFDNSCDECFITFTGNRRKVIQRQKLSAIRSEFGLEPKQTDRS